MIKRLCLACAGLLLLSSCGEYYRVQKSTDLGERYSFAKKSYNEKKYGRVVSLLEDIVPPARRYERRPSEYLSLGRCLPPAGR